MSAYWRNTKVTQAKERQITVPDIGNDILYCKGAWS